MCKIVVGAIVYNEKNKFLDKFLNTIKLYSNDIVIIDDGSTDGSYELCSKFTNNISCTKNLFKQNESLLRKKLWDNCASLCSNGDFIIIQDCDEIMSDKSIENFSKEFKICTDLGADAIAWKLYDMWDEDYYRYDKFWTAHRRWWVHAIQYNTDIIYKWNNKNIHCGRIPNNCYYNAYPSILNIKHMGYSTLKLRESKYNLYMELDPKGEMGILEQYKSILDKAPNIIKFEDN